LFSSTGGLACVREAQATEQPTCFVRTANVDAADHLALGQEGAVLLDHVGGVLHGRDDVKCQVAVRERRVELWINREDRWWRDRGASAGGGAGGRARRGVGARDHFGASDGAYTKGSWPRRREHTECRRAPAGHPRRAETAREQQERTPRTAHSWGQARRRSVYANAAACASQAKLFACVNLCMGNCVNCCG